MAKLAGQPKYIDTHTLCHPPPQSPHPLPHSLSSIRQIKAHESIVGLQQACEDSKVGWTARVWLHVHAPLGRVQPEGLQRPLLAQSLHLVNERVATIVPETGCSMGCE